MNDVNPIGQRVKIASQPLRHVIYGTLVDWDGEFATIDWYLAGDGMANCWTPGERIRFRISFITSMEVSDEYPRYWYDPALGKEREITKDEWKRREIALGWWPA